jgi:hypothetical protein
VGFLLTRLVSSQLNDCAPLLSGKLDSVQFVPSEKPVRKGRLGTNALLSSRSAGKGNAGVSGGPLLPPTGLDALSPVVRRFALQAGARELLKGVQLVGEQIWSGERSVGKTHRVCHCLRLVRDSQQGVPVRFHPEQKAGSLGNLQTCGSSWACPVCGAKITERRRLEVRSAVDEARRRGLKVVLITRTVSHKRFETMPEVLGLLKKAMKHLTRGRKVAARRDRWGIVGTIRSTEVTHGVNGWHPHFHELLFLSPGYDLDDLRRSFVREWSGAVSFSGGRRLHDDHGLDAVDCDARIADYVAKWGREPDWQEDRELTKSPSKLGKRGGQRSPLQLLHDFTFEQDLTAGAVWKEYALAMHGSHPLQWSRGLKKLFGLVEKSDEQIVEEVTADAVTLATIPLEEWRLLVKSDNRGKVVELAASGDVAALHDFLNVHAAGRLVEDLAAEERREHGWRVDPRNVHDQTEAGILWRAEQVLAAAELFGWRRGGLPSENNEAIQKAKQSLADTKRIFQNAGKVGWRDRCSKLRC